jgi:raffinose/stachyose/melibiose transport system permease protein
MIMAGAFLVALPMIILFVLMQRQFITGLTVGAVKG